MFDVEIEFKGEPATGKTRLQEMIAEFLISKGFTVDSNFEHKLTVKS